MPSAAGVPVRMALRAEGAAPAAVAPVDQLGDLAKRPVSERELEIQGSVAQTGGPLEPPVQLEDAGVADADVGAHGTPFQPDAPLTFRVQPEREVGIGEGERLLHLAQLEVDASRRCLDIGEAWARFGARFWWWAPRRPARCVRPVLRDSNVRRHGEPGSSWGCRDRACRFPAVLATARSGEG